MNKVVITVRTCFQEVMMRKKAALSLDNRYNTMIDNAFYFCNPPSNQNIVRESRPPKHQYIMKLLYKDLNKLSTEKVCTAICSHMGTVGWLAVKPDYRLIALHCNFSLLRLVGCLYLVALFYIKFCVYQLTLLSRGSFTLTYYFPHSIMYYYAV